MLRKLLSFNLLNVLCCGTIPQLEPPSLKQNLSVPSAFQEETFISPEEADWDLLEHTYSELISKTSRLGLKIPDDFFQGNAGTVQKGDLKYPNGVNVFINSNFDAGHLFLQTMDEIPGVNFFILPFSLQNLHFAEDEKGRSLLIKQAIFLNRFDKLVYGQFEEPLPLHAGLHSPLGQKEMEEIGLPMMTHSSIYALTEDKVRLKELLESHRIPTPKWTVISKEDNRSFRHDILVSFIETEKPAEIVLKPYDRLGGEGVQMFPVTPDSNEKTVLFLNHLLQASSKVLVEERIDPIEVWNEAGDLLDWNIRALITLNKLGQPYVAGLVVRAAPHGMRPVNWSTGAETYSFEAFINRFGLSSKDKSRLRKRVHDVALKTAKAIIEEVSFDLNLLALDLMIEKESRRVLVIEANSGNVEGIERLIPFGKKEVNLNTAKQVAQRLALVARRYERNLSSQEISSEQTLHLPTENLHLAWLQAGIAYAIKEERAKALFALKKALHFNPENIDTLFMLGVVYQETGQLEKARSTFQSVLKKDPLYINALLNLGLLYWDMGEKVKAIALFKEGVALYPENKELLFLLGNSYRELNDWEKVKIIFDRLSILEPQDPEIWSTLGQAYTEEKMFGWAQLKFKRALQLDPYFVPALIGLGKIAVEKGEKLIAVQYFSHVLDLEPKNWEAKLFLLLTLDDSGGPLTLNASTQPIETSL